MNLRRFAVTTALVSMCASWGIVPAAQASPAVAAIDACQSMCAWVDSYRNEFYPLVDMNEDEIVFTVGMSNTGSSSVVGSGQLVIKNSADATVWTSDPVTDLNANEISWNGVGASGNRVPDGTYVAVFSFTIGQTTYTSPGHPFAVKPTAVDFVDLSASVSKVFPVTDGYKDAVRFSIGSETLFGEDPNGTGTIKISKQGSNKVAKNVSFAGVGYHEIVWNGKLNNKIVPGLYNVKVTMRASEGPAMSEVIVVEVSPKKLVTKTAVLNRSAREVMPYIESYDYGACTYNGGTVYGDTWYSDALCYGSVGIPSAVLEGRQIGNVSVEVTLKVVKPIYAYFGFWTADTTTGGMKIISSTGTKKLNMGYLVAGYSRLQLQMYLPEFSTGTISSVSVKFTYKALQ